MKEARHAQNQHRINHSFKLCGEFLPPEKLFVCCTSTLYNLVVKVSSFLSIVFPFTAVRVQHTIFMGGLVCLFARFLSGVMEETV